MTSAGPGTRGSRRRPETGGRGWRGLGVAKGSAGSRPVGVRAGVQPSLLSQSQPWPPLAPSFPVFTLQPVFTLPPFLRVPVPVDLHAHAHSYTYVDAPRARITDPFPLSIWAPRCCKTFTDPLALFFHSRFVSSLAPRVAPLHTHPLPFLSLLHHRPFVRPSIPLHLGAPPPPHVSAPPPPHPHAQNLPPQRHDSTARPTLVSFVWARSQNIRVSVHPVTRSAEPPHLLPTAQPLALAHAHAPYVPRRSHPHAPSHPDLVPL
ncbi:hypothetical protein HETIRDRAFT_104433 [Heterobasidion irregulare TC 32-1]|uniref:Uncharacterized protein n=1 Tax=Heterobasidion irregulare (strain TC 32-1) TaxID=747525 RepID=W4K084_HETIT|nr:uncharacterized protein HETIRDRAFT_104433 [Heterobasidion irregulare TC 32-1]ETW79139.1 hypothetical protein HETIRDRAFT_104433 [Heterobasidion irregulare TC 32-1]